jgi:spore coat polysaccharide biosynthesis protein SpsF
MRRPRGALQGGSVLGSRRNELVAPNLGAKIGEQMRVIGVVQARLSSRRLPGKILMKLRDRPSLDHLLEGLRHAVRLDHIVLATSIDPSDAATVEFAAARGISCHRGPLDDVAARLLQAGEEHQADAIVRVSGDSPLIDPAIVDHAVGLFCEGAAEIVTNVRPRTFPKGQSVEVIALATLRRTAARMTTPQEREHVTQYVYAHPEEYSIRPFITPDRRPDVQLSIDDAEDFARCAAILEALPGPPWQVGWRACVEAYDRYMAARGMDASR